MKRIAPLHLPRMRVQGLVVEKLPDEVLVYDLDRDKAHCLNRTAALVWHHCDGLNTVAEIRIKPEMDLGAPVDEKLVWFALSQLGRDHLLEATVAPPSMMVGLTRRELVRALAVASLVAVPVVTSIIAPTPAQANTCTASGDFCSASADCCSKACSAAICA